MNRKKVGVGRGLKRPETPPPLKENTPPKRNCVTVVLLSLGFILFVSAFLVSIIQQDTFQKIQREVPLAFPEQPYFLDPQRSKEKEIVQKSNDLLEFERGRISEIRCAQNLSITTQPELCFYIFPDFLRSRNSRSSKSSSSSSSSSTKEKCPFEIQTQMTTNRLSRLESILVEWDGYLSISVFSPQDELSEAAEEVRKIVERDSNVLKRTSVHFVTPFLVQKKDSYPINIMRNIAFDYGFENAEYCSIYDIDFIPSQGLCQVLEQFVESFDLSQLSNYLDVSYLLGSPLKHDWNVYSSNYSKIVSSQNEFGAQALEKNDFLFVTPTMEMLIDDQEKRDSFRASKKEIRVSFRVDIDEFHQKWHGQDIGFDRWLYSDEPFILESEDITRTELYGWFHRETFFSRIQENNLSVCEPFYFNRGYNKVICYRTIRAQRFIPLIIPNGWIFHDLDKFDYQPTSSVYVTKQIFRFNVCRNHIRSFPGKSRWFVTICSRLFVGGKKRSMKIRALQQNLVNAISASLIFQEASDQIGKILWNEKDAWKIAVSLLCQKESFLFPTTVCPRGKPMMKPIKCENITATIDMAPGYGWRYWQKSLIGTTETEASLISVQMIFNILEQDVREVLPHFTGSLSLKAETDYFIPIQIQLESPLALQCLRSELFFDPITPPCEPWKILLDDIESRKTTLADHGVFITFISGDLTI